MLQDTLNQSTNDWVAASEMRQDPRGHDNCTIEDCERNNIDTATYQQSHIWDDQRCERLFPDLQKVMTILREDKIPVVHLEIVKGNPQLIVSASSKDAPGDYVAFSHVWTDRLGGSTDKGLNLCQAERLNRLFQSYISTTATATFWLDCLCIPRKALDQEVYFKALYGIRDVYTNACAVLVVDKTIEEYDMQRMWTYEEAVLAKSLVFVLKSGFHTYKANTWPAMRQTVAVVWQSLAAQLYPLRVKPSKLNIGHIFQAFRYQLTNVPKEEFLSVSGMLGLDTESLMKCDGQGRMKVFWLMLKWVPSDVPFMECFNLPQAGFRWAPATMMFSSFTQMDTECHTEKAECTEHSLLGTYLMVNFTSALMGNSAGKPTSIFYVWVYENHGGLLRTAASRHLALLRVYCVKSWLCPPNGLEFDSIMFQDETKTILSVGNMVLGVSIF